MRTGKDSQPTGYEQTTLVQPLTAGYAVGTVLAGKYRLEALLGEGGMGAVWQATNLLLDLPVAIKLIRAGLDRGTLRDRLRLEARSAAKLGHPAIVRVYDVGESELGDPFIVMEHLRGETLAQLLSRGPLPATRAAQLLLPMIDALAMAHGRGIVHRDLKPDNLMLALEEQHLRPKILDFGVAKLTDPRDADHKLTEAGVILGSPEYMSPEQARGCEDVDASTDIWSICVVLYEAITGYPPFTAANCHALLHSIIEDAPKPLPEQADDGKLWQILERGLDKDRARRYAKISELGQALAGWLIDQGVTEDACGSSLDSKWFRRSSSPLGSRDATALRALSEPPPSRPGHGSTPSSSSAIARPFSATIRPGADARMQTRTLGAVVGVSALVGVLLLALFNALSSPQAAPPSARAPTTRALAAAATFAPSPPTGRELPEPAPSAQIEVRPMSSANPKPEAKPVVVAAPVVPKPTSTGVRAMAARANAPVARPTASSAPPASPAPSRPLDLLAPY